jgi:hypothetical protein
MEATLLQMSPSRQRTISNALYCIKLEINAPTKRGQKGHKIHLLLA